MDFGLWTVITLLRHQLNRVSFRLAFRMRAFLVKASVLPKAAAEGVGWAGG